CAIAFGRNVVADEKDDQRVQRLIHALESKDAFERRDAAKQLGEETGYVDTALPHLTRVLTKDSNFDVAEAAAFAISRFGKQGEAELLRAADHKEPNVRLLAIKALSFSAKLDSEGLKKAAAHLADSDSKVRGMTLDLIARLRYSDSLDTVLKMIRSDE